MIKLDDILVTQSSVRDMDALDGMTFFVYTGGFWTHDELHKYTRRHNLRTSPLIQISRFEDGQTFLHDGHHRCLSVYGGGRDYLRDDEYQISDWKYSEYMEINFDAGWITPFDPRLHLRTADLNAFKSSVNRLRRNHGNLIAEDYICKNPNCYRLFRNNLTNVASLFERINQVI